MEQAVLVMTNVPDTKIARTLGRQLVEQKLAACVNLLPGVLSTYRWHNAIEEADEVTLLIKTTQARYSELETAITSLHPYQVPEILMLPIMGGLPTYLAWIAQETKNDASA